MLLGSAATPQATVRPALVVQARYYRKEPPVHRRGCWTSCSAQPKDQVLFTESSLTPFYALMDT